MKTNEDTIVTRIASVEKTGRPEIDAGMRRLQKQLAYDVAWAERVYNEQCALYNLTGQDRR